VRPLFSHAGGAAALATGRTVFLTNVVNWFLSNIDRVIIGRVLNAYSVGLYNVAYNLASVPNTLLLGALQPTFLATGAKLQDEPQRLAQGWLIGLACVLVLATPAAVVFALLSADLVAFLYGPAWSETGWVLAVLFLCLPAWACWGISTPVLWNTGRKHLEYLLQLPLLALALPAWWFFAPTGIRSIALISVAVIFARALVIITAALRALGLRWSVLVPSLARGLGIAAACGAGALLGQELVSGLAWHGAPLFAGGFGALAVLVVLVGAWPQVLGAEAQGIVGRLVPFLRVRWAPALPATGAEGMPR
jgi:O-antigen/teichoic acid export membrane protein